VELTVADGAARQIGAHMRASCVEHRGLIICVEEGDELGVAECDADRAAGEVAPVAHVVPTWRDGRERDAAARGGRFVGVDRAHGGGMVTASSH
jgi:hypothetical protein